MSNSRTRRPRVRTRVHVLHDDAAIYSLQETKRKPRVTAETLVTLKDNKRLLSKLGYTDDEVSAINTLIPKRKIWRMFIKSLNKGNVFHYRNNNLSDVQHLDTTPFNKPVNLDKAFIRRQWESAKNYGKRVNRNTQAGAQVSSLQVA
jgi:hypothetical protein